MIFGRGPSKDFADRNTKRVAAMPFVVMKAGKVLAGAKTRAEAERMAEVTGGTVVAKLTGVTDVER